MYQKYFKRLFDIIFSLILIIFFLPFMILIFFLVWFFIGFPIFSQRRPGLNNKIFTLYKFKTLKDISKHMPNKKRQNMVGNFLRRTGLDELPQLFNILENTMSFVGPRPLLIKYLKIKEFKNHYRNKIKPGVTGLAQIESFNVSTKNNNQKWRKQFLLDKNYCNNQSFKLDIKILFLTLIKFITFKKKDFHNIKEEKLSRKHFK